MSDEWREPHTNAGRPKKKPIEPGKGPIAFGCGTIITVVAVLPFALENFGFGWRGVIVLIVAALAGGLVASRVGDAFFEKGSRWLAWLGWW